MIPVFSISAWSGAGKTTFIAMLTRRPDIDIRFIELMPILEDFSTGKFISSQKVLDTLPELEPLGTMELLRMFQFKGARESTRN